MGSYHAYVRVGIDIAPSGGQKLELIIPGT